MKKFKALALASMLAIATSNVHAYNVVDRYKLIDDKLKTEQMLRPFGHDFFLDIGVAMNKNAKQLVTDISDAGKASNPTTAAQTVLTNYDKTEQTIKLNLNVGVPVFRFTAWNVKVQPNLRAFIDAGANLGIRKDTLAASDVFSLFNVSIPDDKYKQDVITSYDNAAVGGDVLAWCATNGSDAIIKQFCSDNANKFKKPDSTIPNLNLFAKLDAKVGLFNDYTYEDHFFGNLNLYMLSRTDIFQIISKDMIAGGSKVDLPKTKNTENTLQLDYRFGYKNDNYKVFASVEELKLNTMKKRDSASKELSYGYNALMRVHADATYKYSALTLNPFLGVHKRSGYGFADGLYLGADAGAYVWGDRLGLQLRGMLDKQYFTISPRMKLWLLQLEYAMKSPMKATDGDVKLSAIHSIDLRLFF